MVRHNSVLILDNNELFSHFDANLIEVGHFLGLKVLHVKSVEAALNQLKTGNFDCFIADRDLFFTLQTQDLIKPITTLLIVDVDDRATRKEAIDAGCIQLIARHYSRDEINFVLGAIVREPGQNRRKYPRVLAGFLGSAATAHLAIEGVVLNVSEGGIFMKCISPLRAGDEIKLTMEFPHGKESVSIQCRAKVVYVKPFYMDQALMIPGMGVQFLEIPDTKEREIIKSYISDHLMRPQ